MHRYIKKYQNSGVLGNTLTPQHSQFFSDLQTMTMPTPIPPSLQIPDSVKRWSDTKRRSAQDTGTKADNVYNKLGLAGKLSDTLGSLIPQNNQSSLTTGVNRAWDATASSLSQIPGIGSAIGGSMKVAGLLSDGLNAMGVGTDQMTTTDKLLDSKLFKMTPLGLTNSIGARKADSITKDTDAFNQVGSSYGGTQSVVDNALTKSGKKYGLLSGGSRDKANRQIHNAKMQQTKMSNIADANAFTASNNPLISLGTQLQLNGGYQQNKTRFGKTGFKIDTEKAKNVVKLAQPTKERTLDELVTHANSSNANFVKRLNEPSIRTIPTDDGNVMSHKLGYAGVGNKTIVFPQVQEINGQLKYIGDWREALKSAIQNKDTLEMSPSEAELFTTQYKTKYPGFKSLKFKDGGTVNVIPDGALHKNKHHLGDIDEKFDEVTNKGIPVISENGDDVTQHAEVEREEIIFNLDVTKELEKLMEDGSDSAAIEAGKLLVKEILENTVDNTGLLNKIE